MGASETWLTGLIHGLPVPTFVLDAEHRVMRWNHACEVLTGALAVDMLGTKEPWRAFYTEPRLILANLVLNSANETEIKKLYGDKFRPSSLIKGAWEAEDYIVGCPGGPRWLLFTAAPLFDESGKMAGVVETLRDITERKNAMISSRLYEHVVSPVEFEIIREVNRFVSAANSIEQLVDFVFERISQCVPCDRIGIAFIEEKGRRLVAYYAVARYETLYLKKGFSQDIAGSTLESVIRQGQPRIINDLSAYLELHPKSVSTSLMLREGVCASLTCPLIVDDRPIGVLFFSACEPNVYAEHHARLQWAIAERLSQVAEKAYRIEQLENINRAYHEVMGFVAHELKNPVASMVTNARLLADGYLGDITPQQRQKIERIAFNGQHLIGFVETYLDLAKVENAEQAPTLEEVEDVVAESVEPAIDLLENQANSRRMTLEINLPKNACRIRCSSELLRIVMVNLIGNAIKYGKECGLIRVSVHEDESDLEFSVWNEGYGFPPEKRGDLFRRFSRQNTHDLIRKKGTGLGLYTCWKIVQMHEGRIWAESELGAWASFTFRIPKEAKTIVCEAK
ncbi:hypothetical protein CCP2SC5_270017 [Azospirillaceae bacterium]